ncbi:MAG: AAA family ATPase [Candidatus Hadarchaeum sp.]|uniref:AAA family ATPase n=1 Tax=Candidatus Hadarchaeum sp. TaxID=2883567 RepID=UPI003D11210D
MQGRLQSEGNLRANKKVHAAAPDLGAHWSTKSGKATLMLKMVEDAISEGTDPKKFSTSNSGKWNCGKSGRIRKLVDRNLNEGKFLIFLDEVQKVAGWEDKLKAIYEKHKGHLKRLISGPESLFIRERSKKTLAGSLFEFSVEPLSFKEYLAFRGVDFRPVMLYEKELSRLFDEFILTQGFPELVGINEKTVLRKYLRESIVEKVVFEDLALLFGIRDLSHGIAAEHHHGGTGATH